MPILTQVNSTKFRSLKYGGDRLNGGSSSQPYIQTPIPEDSPGTGGPDFLLRGGLLTPVRIARDVSRLTQMFVDTKSLNGLLFTAKQNVLSLTDVNTSAGSKPSAKTFLDINSKVYLPTSTIAQAAVTPLGIHLSKQGIIPENLLSGVNLLSNLLIKDESRLSNLYEQHILNYSVGKTLYSYGGGPGSVGGIGTTIIKLASDRTGKNNSKITNNATILGFSFSGNKFRTKNEASTNNSLTVFDSTVGEFRKNDKGFRLGASDSYNLLTNNNNSRDLSEDFYESTGQARSSDKVIATSVTSPSSLIYRDFLDIGKQYPLHEPIIKEDFRDKIKDSPLYSRSLDYVKQGIDKRINFNPIQLTNKQKQDYSSTSLPVFDNINKKTIYNSQTEDNFKPLNDLIPFRIAIINNDSPDESVYIQFRAYIDSFNDSYSSQWNDINYVGRGEKFYRYAGFSREVSLSWTVFAHSKAELIPMYEKLNYLASSLAPDYSSNGYMRGNIVKLTMGGYFHEQPGIITSIVYDVPQESTWEIGIGTNELKDGTTSQLPHMIKVTNVRFIPIHTFVPELGKDFIARKLT